MRGTSFAARRAPYIFLLIILVLFSTGAYRWAFKVNRMKPQAINPVMYPSFTEEDTTTICCSREPYYRLWRTYDWMADGYAPVRQRGLYHRVPMVYVHGNGGSYYCARSLARFVYEANVRQRHNALKGFRAAVKRQLWVETVANESIPKLEEGERVPSWLQQKAEAAVVRQSMPLLATELFSVDYLEESYTQSGPLTIKEARFLNHTLHFLMDGFLRTYHELLEAPEDPVFDSNTLTKDEEREYKRPTPFPVQEVEGEFIMSACTQDAPFPTTDQLCRAATTHVQRFSSLERIRTEVKRVRDNGFWVWAESMGGTVAIVAALFSPQLVAGIVLVGSPTHYPPLFFDVGSTWLFRAVYDASVRHYPLTQLEPKENWERDILPHTSPIQLLENLKKVPSTELSARLSTVSLISINGGALDDIVPSISGYLLRSTPRHGGWLYHKNRTHISPVSAYRRDVSTEMLVGTGMPMDHRGLVYGLQFLQNSADSLVAAALLPDTTPYIGKEEGLPRVDRPRLFPTIAATVPPTRRLEKQEQLLHALSLRDFPSGGYAQQTIMRALNDRVKEVCVSGKEPFDFNTLPVLSETDDNDYYDGSKPLHIMIGFTTYAPEKVHLPDLKLYRNEEQSEIVISEEVQSEAATIFTLPSSRKDGKPVKGRTLMTAVSFRVRRLLKRRREAEMLWPKFCFLVDRDEDETRHHTYFQHDLINVSSFVAKQKERYLGPHYVGNKLQVETQNGYALLTGVDSATLETHLEVEIHKKSRVYPVTIAGSVHSFYLAMRGNSDVALDEPEAQLQFFFGPFDKGRHNYTYSWKAFSVFPENLNSTYLFYTLSDTVERPNVTLGDLGPLSKAIPLGPRFWLWWCYQWPERWLAVFSAYSGIGKLGGSYILLFFTLYFFWGLVEEKFYQKPELRRQQERGFIERRVRRVVSPMMGMILTAVLLEFFAGTWADYALKVCRDPNPPPLTDEAMTERMDFTEKLTLVLMYWLPPQYRECRYSWIRVQSVPVWSAFVEHMATIYLGYVMAALLLVIVLLVDVAMGVVAFPVNRLVLRPVVRRWPTVGVLVLVTLWALPNVYWATHPAFAQPYLTAISVLGAQAVGWLMPATVQPGYSYRWAYKLLAVAAMYPSHFDGLVLSIRNEVLLHNSPEALADPERYLLTTPQYVVHALVQTALAMGYITVFLVLRHEAGVKIMQEAKAKDGVVGDAPYVLGDINRKHRWFRATSYALHRITIYVGLWCTAVAMRRPLEGGLSLIGNMLLLFSVASFLMERW